MTDTASDVAEGAGRYAAWVFAREGTASLAAATQEWMQHANLDEARRLAFTHANLLNDAMRTGHAFEFVEALKFNANAARTGDAIRAVTTASQKASGAAADIILTRDGEVVRRVQAKVYEQTSRRVLELSSEKYHGMQRLVPSDHEHDAQDLLSRRLRMPKGNMTERYGDVDRNLSGALHHDGITSGGTKSAEAIKAGNDPVGWLHRQVGQAAVNETLKAAAIGAAGGAVFGAAAHSLQIAIKARHTDVGISESIVEITTAATRAGIRSGATSGLAKVVEIGARNSKIFSPLAKSTAPIAVANTVLEVGEAAYKFATGAIDRDELVDRCAGAALRNSGAWAFGIIGQTVVPIPVVGALVGSTAGYVTSAIIVEGFKMARVASAEADAAEDRLLELETQAMAAVMAMEQHRLTVEALISQEAEHYRDVLVPLMDGLERNMTLADYSAIDHLVALNLELSSKLEWSTLPQFDDFMADPDRTLQL